MGLSESWLYNGVIYIRVLFSIFQQYKYRDLTVREITNVISQYKDLKPVMDAYVFNDGSSRDLMSLTGTVPVSYRGGLENCLSCKDEGSIITYNHACFPVSGNVYNIPVCLWLLDMAEYLKRVTEMLRPSPYCDTLSGRSNETKT
uniref:UEV domain-containing protein n=1 Tax=Sinocyclocheilus rhinocerous TaxID=307959 RepID=A0A673N5K6_9TELE